MQHHVSKYFARIQPTPPPTTLGMWSIGQNSTFSKHGHVAHQIRDKHECSNMVENILPTDPIPGDGVSRSEFNIFQNMVVLHIKLKRVMNAATWLPADPQPWGWDKIKLFTDYAYVSYQI